ncbi:MAG: FG-GAP-like repeat-containing protein, partial [Candidatus Angelobacter sp.]
MNLKISVALITALVAAFGLLTRATQPDSIEAARLNNIGCAYMNQQLFEKGLNEFQKALQADPKFTIARLNEGVAYSNLQKVDEAKAALDDALKQDPKNPNAWYSLGLLAKNMGDAQASIEDFKHVTEIDPNDADTWYFLGTAYVQAKQFPQAIEAFERALKINSLHASAEFGLSRAYQQSADVNNAREHLKKFQYITQNKIGAPMSLAYGEQGKYSRAVESPQAQLKPPALIKVQFVDATKAAALMTKAGPAAVNPSKASYEPGSGACFLDYDNDGHIDIFVADHGATGSMSLYHNLGNGKFEDVTKQAGLDPETHAVSCSAGDYDNDGYVDLAVSSAGGFFLLHNEKNGTFKNVASAAGIKGKDTDQVVGIVGMAFIDYDHDGDLDLYGASGPGASATWRNNGDGTFTPVDIGISLPVSAANAIGSDYNNDRAVDLVVADWAGGTLFQNPREGKFSASHPFSGESSSDLPTVGITGLDFDHDGWTDFALTRLR